ncbi:31221_t:CDS:2, partial [Racocetra persica]
NDKDKEKIKKLQKTLATKEIEIEDLKKDKERYKLETKTWKDLYDKAKDEKERNLRKSEEEKRKINLEIQKNVLTIITLVKKFLPYLMRQIIAQFEKLAESGNQKMYNIIIENVNELDVAKLFQQERSKYNKLILSDIAICLVFTSVHTRQIGNLLGIAPLEEIGNIVFGDLTSQQWVDHYKISVAEKKTYQIPPPDPQNQQDLRYLTDTLSYYLGKKFSLPAGQSGLPVYISDREIEIAYRYNATIENALDLAQIIVQQLQQGQNDLPKQDEDVEMDDPQAKQPKQTPLPIINNLFDQLKKKLKKPKDLMQ